MKWLYFILSHSIFIAICAASLVFQTIQLLHISANVYIYGFIFFAVIGSYNTYWLLSKYSFGNNFPLPLFLKKAKVDIGIVAVAYIGVIYCYVQLQIPLAVILPAIVLTCLYCLPIIPVRLFKFTRKAGILKTTVLSFTWAYVTVVIPLQKTLQQFNSTEVFILTRRFLFMLMLCIIFDSRDKIVDRIRGLHSLATDVSARVLKWLILCIFLILFTSNFLSGLYGISIRHAVALQISTVVLLVTYYFSTKKQGYLFYYFWVDGQMLFSALLTYIVSI